MKKLMFVFAIIFVVSSSAFALSDAEYRTLMKNQAFANADKALNVAWAEAKDILYGSDFDKLKRNQQQWIKSGRDSEARYFMQNQGLSKVEAYAKVTNARANYIRNQIRELSSPYDILVSRMTQSARQITKSSKPNTQASNMKAWNDKNNLVVFEYSGKNSFLIRFWTSASNLDFNGIKVGTSLKELEKFFDGEGYYDANGSTYTVGANKQWVEFGLRNSMVSYIEFVQADGVIPRKIQNIVDRYEKH